MHKLLQKRNRGFTLLELLVVISIIGILIAISAAAFTTAQQKARNAKRQGDVNAMAKAFEQYYAINGSSYAATCGAMAGALQGGIIPSDPKTGVRYDVGGSCVSDTVANTYCVCATLEPTGTTAGNSNATANATCSGLSAGSGQYFCIKNQQ